MSDAEIDDAISRMKKPGSDGSGRCTLYRNPGTMILCELFYPHGGMHGGGPRDLRFIAVEDAVAKYGTSALYA